MVRPHIFENSIGQERDRFIIPRLLTNRIVELYEDEPPKSSQILILSHACLTVTELIGLRAKYFALGGIHIIDCQENDCFETFL